MQKQNPDSNAPSKELTCDQYINLLEEKLNALKQIRQQFLQKKITPGVYEENTMKSLQQLQHGLDGVRHTFLPLTIPPYLQISPELPKWITLTQSQASEYANYSVQNDKEQKEMLRRFRRPGMRRADIQRAAKLLNVQQNKVLEKMKWSQADFVVGVFSTNVRAKINPNESYSHSLLKDIKSYVEENSLDYPVDDDTLSLFVMSIFDDDAPLASGYPKAKNIQQEVSFIASTICKYAPDFPVDKVVDFVKPYIAHIHCDQLIPSFSSSVQEVINSIKYAYDILGKDASMADFGIEGVSSLTVLDGLKALKKAKSPDEIIRQLQEIGDDAISSTQNSQSNAAAMIAASLISSNLIIVPNLFAYAIAWGSEYALETFKNKPLYIMVFDAITNVLNDFKV
ncbi:hypothetical protein M9Y10_005599 [Tritrichomonas musculus]|uniref:Uncharacterized protein n=1 Tax=Tritrichomonas musculus TaxID=1915356 RepID=A0ABR2JC75_9EUKA